MLPVLPQHDNSRDLDGLRALVHPPEQELGCLSFLPDAEAVCEDLHSGSMGFDDRRIDAARMRTCHGQFLPSPGGNAPLGFCHAICDGPIDSKPAHHLPLTTEDWGLDFPVNPETGGGA